MLISGIKWYVCFVIHMVIALCFIESLDDATWFGGIYAWIALAWCLAGSIISAYLIEIILDRALTLFLGFLLLVVPVGYLIFSLSSIEPLSTIFYVLYLIVISVVGFIPGAIIVVVYLIMNVVSALGGTIGNVAEGLFLLFAIIPSVVEGILVGRWISINLGNSCGRHATIIDEHGDRKDVYF